MRGGWVAALSVGVVVGLGGCATLFHHITTKVSPETGASGESQLRLACNASSSGRCYFRYVDVATKARTEYVVEEGQQTLVADIAAPAKLCIWTSSVDSFCPVTAHEVSPRGGISFNFKF